MLDLLYSLKQKDKVLPGREGGREEEDTTAITVQSNEQAKYVKHKHVWLRSHLIVNSPFLHMYNAWHCPKEQIMTADMKSNKLS